MAKNPDIELFKDGKRLDGRAPEDMREIKMEVGVLPRAQGSAYLEWGNNKVLAGVYGPRKLHPAFLQNPTKALVRCIYNMAPFSVEDRKRPGPDRRSTEISKISSEALESVVLTGQFPNSAIDVFVEVLQADAGTRCAGLTCASLALADAGIPMKDMVASCAAGKAGGEVIVDMMKEEDNYGEADVPVAIIPRKNEVVLLQMDGKLTNDEFKKAFSMAIEGCKHVYEIQKKALMDASKLEEDSK